MSFINDLQEVEKFNNKKYVVERNVLPNSIFNDVSNENCPDNYDTRLKTVVKREIDKLIENRREHMIGCMFIEAEPDDGMTWAAQSTYTSIQQGFKQFKNNISCLKGYQHLKTAQIANIIGQKSFFQSLKQTKLVHWHSKEKYVQLLFIAATLARITDELVLNVSSNPAAKIADVIFFNPLNIVLILLSVFLAFFLNKLTSSFNEQSIREKYFDQLNEQSSFNSDAYYKAVAAITNSLTPTEPRILIIDNYNDLDKTTRLALENYLLNYANQTVFEFWIIFYRREGINSPSQFLAQHQTAPVVVNNSNTYYLTPVSYSQKKKLAIDLELPLFALEFSKIKMICSSTYGDYSSIQLFLENYRKKYHPELRTYDDLEVLFLLSLNASPGKMYMEQTSYVEILKKDKFFILSEFMGGKSIDNRNIPELIARLLRNFAQFTQTEVNNGVKSYAFIPELKSAFLKEDFYRSLGLPDHHVGHLFWTFYWEGRMTKIREAGWYNKLSHHLIGSGGVSTFPKDKNEIRNQLIKTVFPNTIDGCLISGLFDVVTQLLQIQYICLEELCEENSHEATQLQNLIRFINKCWKAYLLTENDELLDLLNKISTNRLLFSETIESYPYNKRNFEIFPWKDRVKVYPLALKDDYQSITECLDIRNVVYAKTVFIIHTLYPHANSCKPLNHSNSEYFFIGNYEDSFSSILEWIYGQTAERSWQQIDELKLITLSQAVSALGLSIVYYGNDWPNGDDRGKAEEYGKNKIEALVNALHSFLTVLKITQKVEKGNFSQEATYFKQAYIFEFYLNAISALTMATYTSYSQSDGRSIGNFLVKPVNILLQSANQILSFNFPEIVGLKDIIYNGKFTTELEKLFRLCIITSKSLGAENLFSLLTYKSNLFEVLRSKIDFDKLVQASTSTRQKLGITGVMANLLVSQQQAESSELRSTYLLNAIRVAETSGFENQLIYQLLLVFIFTDGELDSNLFDLSSLFSVAAVVSERLKDSLDHIEDGLMDTFTLKINNFMRLIHDQHIKEEALSLVGQRINIVTDLDIKVKLNVFINYQKLLEKIRLKQSIEIDKILDEWRGSEYYLYYAEVLYKLINAGYKSDMLKNDVLVLLVNNRYNFSANTILFVAVFFLITIDDISSADKNEIITFVKECIVYWEQSLTATMNIRIFELLNRVEPQVPLWLSNVRKWEEYRKHISDMQLLYHMDNRQYFDYVKYCYKILKNFGLTTNMPEDEIEKQLHLPTTDILVKVERRLNVGADIPNVFTEVDDGLKLCGEYLVLGSYLFDLSQFSDKKFDSYRDAFNLSAFRDLSILYDIISDLPELPANFREIFLKHNSRFKVNLVE